MNAKGYLATIVSAIIFGLSPLISALIYADGNSSVSLSFFRAAFAVPMLLVVLILKKEKLSITLSQAWRIAVIALFGVFLTPTLLLSSYRYLTGGTATVLHFVYPAAVMLGGALVFREKLKWSNLLCLLLCTGGIALFYSPAEPLNLTGAALALGSGVAYACYVLALSKLKLGQMSRLKLSMYMFLFGAVMLLPFSLAVSEFTVPSNPKTWALCALFSLLVCVLASVLFQVGTKLLGGAKASILSTFEPITSLVVGFLVFSEIPSVVALLGAVLVIASSVLIAYFDMKKENAHENSNL